MFSAVIMEDIPIVFLYMRQGGKSIDSWVFF